MFSVRSLKRARDIREQLVDMLEKVGEGSFVHSFWISKLIDL